MHASKVRFNLITFDPLTHTLLIKKKPSRPDDLNESYIICF